MNAGIGTPSRLVWGAVVIVSLAIPQDQGARELEREKGAQLPGRMSQAVELPSPLDNDLIRAQEQFHKLVAQQVRARSQELGLRCDEGSLTVTCTGHRTLIAGAPATASQSRGTGTTSDSDLGELGDPSRDPGREEARPGQSGGTPSGRSADAGEVKGIVLVSSEIVSGRAMEERASRTPATPATGLSAYKVRCNPNGATVQLLGPSDQVALTIPLVDVGRTSAAGGLSREAREAGTTRDEPGDIGAQGEDRPGARRPGSDGRHQGSPSFGTGTDWETVYASVVRHLLSSQPSND